MANKDKEIIILEKDNTQKKYEILFTAYSKDTNKNYIIYSDKTKNENGEYYVHFGSFDPQNKNLGIIPITDEKEWAAITQI